MRPPVLATLAAVVITITACSDTTVDPLAPEISRSDIEGQIPTGEGDFHRYVAIGTSISMGVQSDGVYSATQLTSWPAQLGRLANREITLPLIAFPGSRSPRRTSPSTARVRSTR
jgi:hypothetical protein